MTDQQPLVGVQIGPDFSPDIWTHLESAPRGTREGVIESFRTFIFYVASTSLQIDYRT